MSVCHSLNARFDLLRYRQVYFALSFKIFSLFQWTVLLKLGLNFISLKLIISFHNIHQCSIFKNQLNIQSLKPFSSKSISTNSFSINIILNDVVGAIPQNLWICYEWSRLVGYHEVGRVASIFFVSAKLGGQNFGTHLIITKLTKIWGNVLESRVN